MDKTSGRISSWFENTTNGRKSQYYQDDNHSYEAPAGPGGSEIHYYQLSGSLLEITNGIDNLLSAKGCLVKEL